MVRHLKKDKIRVTLERPACHGTPDAPHKLYAYNPTTHAFLISTCTGGNNHDHPHLDVQISEDYFDSLAKEWTEKPNTYFNIEFDDGDEIEVYGTDIIQLSKLRVDVIRSCSNQQ